MSAREVFLKAFQAARKVRIDIKRMFRDPTFRTLRRYIMAGSLVAMQARKGVDITFESAYSLQS